MAVFKRLFLGIGLIVSLSSAQARPLNIDVKQSAISVVFKQLNVPVEAKFNRFNAKIDWNANAPQQSKAEILVDVGTMDLGDATYNKEIRKKEWFNTAQFPLAAFQSTAVRVQPGNNQLEVFGDLTLKGKTIPLKIQMKLVQRSPYLIFEGTLPINRLDFGIGEGEWSDTGIVANEVVIKFRIATL